MSVAVVPLQTLSALQQADSRQPEPFRIQLPDNTVLLCMDMLRSLPGKRMVLRAEYQGRIVLAKLFFDARHWQKERDGYALLKSTCATTPTLLADYRLDHGGICLYEFIPDAEPLDALWRKCDTSEKVQLLEKILRALQQGYQQHVLQQDLHLGNFLLHEHTLVVLDPASCTQCNTLHAQADNLALLLAQLPFSDWQTAADIIHSTFPAVRHMDIIKKARQCWQKRQRDYLGKIFRECSDVADLSMGSLRILCRRNSLSDNLTRQLRDLGSLKTHATILKDGNSAKVFALDVDGRKFVVKQYINKDWLRKIRRAWRPSRAARSWYFSHAFAFAGIAVPTPVALIEQKYGPFVSSAWFISEYSDGGDLLTHWQEREPSTDELSCIHSLFLTLQLIHTSHGDMKASNLITDGTRITLIDYDGAREHKTSAAFSRALAEDKQRFLQNWASNPALQDKLREWLDT